MIPLILIFLVIIYCIYYMDTLNKEYYYDPYYNKYAKYKNKYISLKDDDLQNIEQIIIKLIDRSEGGILPPTVKYEKIISIDKGENIGTVFIKKSKINEISKYNVTRDQILNLLNKIKYIWALPSARSTEDPVYKGILLEIYQGDKKKWVNGKPSGCIHMAPSIQVTAAQQQIYYNTIDIILNDI